MLPQTDLNLGPRKCDVLCFLQAFSVYEIDAKEKASVNVHYSFWCYRSWHNCGNCTYTSIMQPYDCLILTIGIYRDEVFRGMLFHCRTQKTLRLINIAYDGIWPDSLCSLGNFDCHSSRDIEKFIHDLSRNWYHCCIVQSKCSQKLSFFAVCIFWKQVLALDKLINRYSEETSPLCLGT